MKAAILDGDFDAARSVLQAFDTSGTGEDWERNAVELAIAGFAIGVPPADGLTWTDVLKRTHPIRYWYVRFRAAGLAMGADPPDVATVRAIRDEAARTHHERLPNVRLLDKWLARQPDGAR